MEGGCKGKVAWDFMGVQIPWQHHIGTGRQRGQSMYEQYSMSSLSISLPIRLRPVTPLLLWQQRPRGWKVWLKPCWKSPLTLWRATRLGTRISVPISWKSSLTLWSTPRRLPWHLLSRRLTCGPGWMSLLTWPCWGSCSCVVWMKFAALFVIWFLIGGILFSHYPDQW